MNESFMHTFFIITGLAIFVFMLPIFYRVVMGPTAIDRIVGVNFIGTKTAVLLIVIGTVFGIQSGEGSHENGVEMFVDFALAYALLNFIGSLAAARFMHKTPPTQGQAKAGEGDLP